MSSLDISQYRHASTTQILCIPSTQASGIKADLTTNLALTRSALSTITTLDTSIYANARPEAPDPAQSRASRSAPRHLHPITHTLCIRLYPDAYDVLRIQWLWSSFRDLVGSNQWGLDRG